MSGVFDRTTSGMNWSPVLEFCLKVVGPDNIMFAVDYPGFSDGVPLAEPRQSPHWPSQARGTTVPRAEA